MAVVKNGMITGNKVSLAPIVIFMKIKKVWHVSGWNYPIEPNDLNDVFLWRLMNCWGWVTWADRWKYYEKNTEQIMKEFSKKDVDKFNFDGVEDFFGQIVGKHKKEINTWAIVWYAIIFKKNGLCLNPAQTFKDYIESAKTNDWQ